MGKLLTKLQRKADSKGMTTIDYIGCIIFISIFFGIVIGVAIFTLVQVLS